MSFITLQVTCIEEKREFILAELSLLAFDAFEETDTGLIASCPEEDWNAAVVTEIMDRYQVNYEYAVVEKVNWNEEWEKNYEPVQVNDQCIVRASFHQPRPDVLYEIIINPKMSFGTGHHATTHQVLKYQIELDHQGKRVLDVGCGTGALAIMAHKRGAKNLVAIDIDEWCVENSAENFALNACQEVDLRLGGIDIIEEKPMFDIILANINKNVLLEQMRDYYFRLAESGILILSGFYMDDISDLLDVAHNHGLKEITRSDLNSWAMLALKK